MSREIRPVALDWEHPREPGTYSDGSPRYRPLHSRESMQYHLEDRAEHPEDYDGPLNPDDYMPELREGTPYGWQMYETTTEGTPVSPVFATKDELAAWLSSPQAGRNRVSVTAARNFVDEGWAPTFDSTPQHGFMSGVEAAEFH